MPPQQENLWEPSIKTIIKRDGRVVEFNFSKIVDAISKAAHAAEEEPNSALATELAKEVVQYLEAKQKGKDPTVEQINDMSERVLIEHNHVGTAKAFIVHRHKKEEQRRQRALILGQGNDEENLRFSAQALTILERRYLLKDKEGNLIETPKKMIQRVAREVATIDAQYGANKEELKNTEEKFYSLMAELYFLPNSPAMMNAGTAIPQLSSCFVLPVEDTMEGIFGILNNAALIHQRGGGTGFSFSRLRPKGDVVNRNTGVASGPVSFMKVYDAALEVIKQGGIRPGANMAVLRVDHPDIIRFIEAKRDKKALKNFNISVAVTDRFMKAVEEDREYYIINPRTEKYVGKLRAKDVFAVITQNAWKTGDPGLLFIDEINRKHPAKHMDEIETTNQCGEAPLLPYEGCMLGSLNLNAFVDQEKQEIRWEQLQQTIYDAVHFLDNAIDKNEYPSEKIRKQTLNTRKFGLGIMGFADLLFKLGVKYDSEEGLKVTEQLMSFIKEHTYKKSQELAEVRGVCPSWKGSDHEKAGRKMRNMACNSIAPTGTISILASASSGCEPLYALSYQKTVLGDRELVYLNPSFEKIAKERKFYSPELIRAISKTGSIQQFKEVPKDVRDVFVTAQDISPEWHIKMQATLQKYVDNSISKTINFPKTAAIRDVEESYMLAWKSKCKGITIYRDGSYEEQVMTIGSE